MQLKALIFSFLFLAFAPVYAQNAPSGLYPISGIAPELPDAELAPLVKMIGNARVVGLGEVSHGTQSDTARHRLAKFLIEKLGYRLIFSEYPMMPSLTPAVQRYLSTCQGDVNQIARFNYGVFQTVETARFLQWICHYNVAHPQDPVHLVGADILYHPWMYRQEIQKLDALYSDNREYRDLLTFLKLNCFGARYEATKDWEASPEYKEWARTGTLDPKLHQTCVKVTGMMKNFIVDHEAEILNKFSPGEFRMLTVAPGSLMASDVDASDYKHDIKDSQTIRDHQMFENFTALWQNFGLNKKAIFMAHNYHVAKAQSRTENRYWPQVISAGESLARWLKTSYKVIGMTAYRVHANYVTQPPILPTSPDSMDAQLNRLAPGFFLVDPLGSFARQKPSWFLMADNTAEYPDGERLVPAEQYDAILYMRECLESHQLSSSRMSTRSAQKPLSSN